MKPTVGRTVHYFPGESDSENIKNNFSEGEIGSLKSAVLPAVIVRVWSDNCVNLKVITDGPVDEWKTSVQLQLSSEQKYCWAWPDIERPVVEMGVPN
jgi:hypothetical protein